MKLRSVVTGVVVNVRDGHSLAGNSDWAPVEDEKPKRVSKKADVKSD